MHVELLEPLGNRTQVTLAVALTRRELWVFIELLEKLGTTAVCFGATFLLWRSSCLLILSSSITSVATTTSLLCSLLMSECGLDLQLSQFTDESDRFGFVALIADTCLLTLLVQFLEHC